ncbi:MAG: rpfC [Phycisphaerales bacterium]|nr:rpfC [Phycisphaerales bacterium]
MVAARDDAERRLAQWRAVLGSMSEGLVVSDPDGNLLDWNRAAMEMYGFSADDEVAGQSARELAAQYELYDLNGQVAPLESRPLARVLRGETFRGVEFQVRRPDRNVDRIISFNGAPVRDPGGNVLLVLLTLHDITDERWAQQALRRSADHLSLALAAAKFGDWAWDAKTDMMTMSPRAAEIFAVPAGTYATRTALRDMLHPEDREMARICAERAAAMHSDYDVEYRVNRGDRVQVWVAAKGRGQYDAAGNLTGMLGVIQDITERKSAEAALRESEERLRLGLDAGNIGTWDWDISIDRVTWSQRVYEFHGLKPGEFGGSVKDFSRLVHPDDAARVHEAVRKSLQERASYAVEFRAVRPNGEVRWIASHGKVYFGPGGTPLRMLGAAADVTARKDAEAEHEHLLASERAARAEAEYAGKMKDEFLATLSHELRTPLNAILGWSQILRTSADGDEDLCQGLETIERNARAQTQIIEDLLDMSRIISGKVRLDVRRVELVPVIEAALDTVRPAADAKGIQLVPVLDPSAGPVFGDPGRLQQVLWNLLSNAIKFTPRGGRVQVVVQRVESLVEASVADNGQGIKAEFLPHVFERFRQADASTTRAHGGLGLGLAIVKQLVELHGGTVRATSPGEGAGATFTIALPMTAPRSPQAGQYDDSHPAAIAVAAAAQPPPSLKGVCVLVVDDEPDARALMKRLLEDCEAHVITAASAAEALASIASRPPDVLVSDIGMPAEDGYALIHKLRQLPPTRGGNTPAVALTAYARPEDRNRVMHAGFQMHIAKPVEPSELITMIADLARRADTLAAQTPKT